MFCSSCGNPNSEAARFCERCGQALEVAPAPMVSAAAPEDPGLMRGAPGYYNPGPAGNAPGYHNPGPAGAALAPYDPGTMRGPVGSPGAIMTHKDPETASSRALWFSCFGLGQFYNDDTAKGLFVMALWWAGLCTGGVVTVIVWIWAFQDARDVASGLKPKW